MLSGVISGVPLNLKLFVVSGITLTSQDLCNKIPFKLERTQPFAVSRKEAHKC